MSKELFLFNECDAGIFIGVSSSFYYSEKCFDTSHKRRQKTDNSHSGPKNRAIGIQSGIYGPWFERLSSFDQLTLLKKMRWHLADLRCQNRLFKVQMSFFEIIFLGKNVIEIKFYLTFHLLTIYIFRLITTLTNNFFEAKKQVIIKVDSIL